MTVQTDLMEPLASEFFVGVEVWSRLISLIE